MSQKKSINHHFYYDTYMSIIEQKLFSQINIGDQFPVHLMGIINLSPESFYKESYISPENILHQIKTDCENGATFLDFGARSTAPWSNPISLQEEYERIEIALNLALPHIPKGVVLSIDTQYAEIAQLALKMTEEHNIPTIINDISSFHTDPKMKDVILEYHSPICLMATHQKPGDAKSIEEILLALNSTIEDLYNEDYDTSKIIIDPGIGKWVSEKTFEYDLEMLDKLHDFRCFQAPILIGLSRKSFIGAVLDEKEPKDRLWGSYAASSVAVYNGAHIIRAHQITSELNQIVRMASAIRKKPVKLISSEHILSRNPVFHTPLANHIFLKKNGVSSQGASIMEGKMRYHTLTLQNITAPQALILKQEMLARGGEVAMSKDVITTENRKFDKIFTIILMGTDLQFKKLISKLKSQDLGLDIIANSIEQFLIKDLTPIINYSKNKTGEA